MGKEAPKWGPPTSSHSGNQRRNKGGKQCSKRRRWLQEVTFYPSNLLIVLFLERYNVGIISVNSVGHNAPKRCASESNGSWKSAPSLRFLTQHRKSATHRNCDRLAHDCQKISHSRRKGGTSHVVGRRPNPSARVKR